MFKVLLFIVLVYANLFGLSNCGYKYEYKNATVNNVGKSVVDYENFSKNVSITFNAIYYSTPDPSTDRMSCTSTNYGSTFTDKTIDSYKGMRNRYLSLMGVSFSSITDDDNFATWQQNSYKNYGDPGTRHSKTFTFKTKIKQCSSSYTKENGKCKKTINYTYKEMTCNGADKNSQGFGWELKSGATNTGVKIDPNTNANNSATLDGTIQSHTSAVNLCRRKYQECDISCVKPLVLDKSTGKCVMDYNTDCKKKGMVYNSKFKKCDKTNQCGNPLAEKSLTSSFCEMKPNCNVVNGVCGDTAKKSCNNNNFVYSPSMDKCTANINCLSSQYALDDKTCGGTAFCSEGDVQESIKCINKKKVTKTCAPFNRTGNLCYEGGAGETHIVYKRPLVKVSLSGGYKEEYFGKNLHILCSENSTECEYRLTDIFTQNKGKRLCFQDLHGVSGCIDIKGDCTFDGHIHNTKGIKQIRIEDGNKIVAYDLMQKPESLGSIVSTCTLSGKVGDISGVYKSSDIISARANGIDIEFWDAYKREFIGVISVVPTIPENDVSEGFTYSDKDVMQLYSNNFTAFYSKNGATYAVYNGEISKTVCQSKINGTSFYIPPGSVSNEDFLVLSGLSLYGSENINYFDGNNAKGTCVVKSGTALSFNVSDYSTKEVSIPNKNTMYVCSPYICNSGSCQYNTCADGFSPTVYEQDFFEKIITNSYPSTSYSDICTGEKCDSNKKYFEFCGNKYGCVNNKDVYQQEDGTCVKATCKENETLDTSTGKCKSIGCVNSTEEDGKCFKTLNLN